MLFEVCGFSYRDGMPQSLRETKAQATVIPGWASPTPTATPENSRCWSACPRVRLNLSRVEARPWGPLRKLGSCHDANP